MTARRGFLGLPDPEDAPESTALVLEGQCPYGHGTLVRDRLPDCGWCEQCGAGWSVERRDGAPAIFRHTVWTDEP